MLDLCIFNYFYVLFEEVISRGNYSNFAVITFFLYLQKQNICSIIRLRYFSR